MDAVRFHDTVDLLLLHDVSGAEWLSRYARPLASREKGWRRSKGTGCTEVTDGDRSPPEKSRTENIFVNDNGNPGWTYWSY